MFILLIFQRIVFQAGQYFNLPEFLIGEDIMFIIYKDNLYDMSEKKTYFDIITRLETKVDGDFLSDDDIYYKQIPLDDKYIQDIFDVEFFLKWDSGLKDVDSKWEILAIEMRMKENQVLLTFAKGILPGWRAEEQTVCSRYVDIDECEDFSVVYTYAVKDGNVLKEPMIVEQKVSKEEFQKLAHQYQIRNI